jgi:predicted GIY-YIG superfamily endonuclease
MPRYDGRNHETDKSIPHKSIDAQRERVDSLNPDLPFVYILHADHEIGSEDPKGKAQHYLGSALSIERINRHVSGHGSKVAKAFNSANVLYTPFLYEMSEEECRAVESYIKTVYKKTKNLCPCCNPKAEKVMSKIRAKTSHALQTQRMFQD